jgi:Predicted integral membrane protein
MTRNTETPTKGGEKPSALSYLLRYGLPLVITVGLCWLLFHNINFSEMMDIIRHNCDFRWIGLALFISVFSHVFRAARWQIQLRALGIKASLWELTLSIFGTYAVNLVFPRLGEVWRTGYIAAEEKAPFTTVFGSMVADRLADTITVGLLTAATFLLAGPQLMQYLSQNPEAYNSLIELVSSPLLWVGLIFLILFVWFLFVKFPEHKLVVKAKEIWKGLWEGFAVIVRMPGKGRWLLLTVAVWGCYFLQLYVAFFSFPLTAEVVSHHGILAVLVCFVLSSISMGVPSNGGIGPWQWAIIFGLSLYSSDIPGLTREYATSFANLVMGMQTLLLIVLGIFTFTVISIRKKRQPSK